MTEKLIEFISMAKKAADAGIMKKLIISKLSDKSIKKAVILPKKHKEKTLFVFERYMSDGKKTQKNFDVFPEDELLPLMALCLQSNLILSEGECEYKASQKGSSTIIGKAKLTQALESGEQAKLTSLNREKQYLLRGDEAFLRELDITDQNGRIKDKRQAKFRQICRFLEYVRDMQEYLKSDRVVIYDLCCGKSYLSFAVYHYFKYTLRRDVYMLCVDLKADVMAHCAEIAKKLGYDGMDFRAADITKLECDTPPDLVLSLHACDTATDLVLENAVRLGAKVILSTPCCHRDMSRKIKCEPLSFALKHSILKSKLCDALTDSLRLVYLEKEGYSADACELVDPEDTPKNVILRAVKDSSFDKASKKAEKKAIEYNTIKEFLGLRGV